MTRSTAHRFCLSAAIMCGLLLAGLGAALIGGDILPADMALRAYVHSFHPPWLTAGLEALTHAGSVASVTALAALACAGFWALHRRFDAMVLAWTMLAGVLLENAMKFSFQRPRPMPFFDLPLPGSYSFPSGHALFATCLYAAIAWGLAGMVRTWHARWMIWTGAGALIVLVGFSRVYLGVHYPSDVLAGWLTGGLCVMCVRLWKS